jgi:membrane-bound serine protease (ClpP class)
MMLLLIIVLMAVGMVLLFLEVAIIPGFGVAGVSAILCLAGGAAVAWLQYGAGWGMGSLILSGGLSLGLVTLAPRTRAGKGLVLQEAITSHAGGEREALLAGRVGLTLTPLRPSGAVDIEGRRVDVVTDGQFIDAGERVKVVSVEGTRVVVASTGAA